MDRTEIFCFCGNRTWDFITRQCDECLERGVDPSDEEEDEE